MMITPTVDLRSNLLAVRQQGRRQSCLAFASSAAHEHQMLSTEHLCVEYLFFQAVERTTGKNPDVGTTMASVTAALEEAGQPVEDAWPYTARQLSPWVPPLITLPFYKTTMILCPLSFSDIISIVDEGRPVVLGLVITDAFFCPDETGYIAALTPDIERGGHAVLAVGHGVDGHGNGALLIRNSWGADWGLGGYAWLAHDYVSRQLHETAILV